MPARTVQEAFRIVAALAAVAVCSAGANAGEVTIGTNFMGHAKDGTCHAISFLSSEGAAKEYRARQKERFEPADPEVLGQLANSVVVTLTLVTTPTYRGCAWNSGIPEKIVITDQARESVLVIPLKAEATTVKNRAGTRFTIFTASGRVPEADILKLDKDYDFHLVYADHTYHDKWKKAYPDEIFKPRER